MRVVYVGEDTLDLIPSAATRAISYTFDGETRSVRVGETIYRRPFDTHDRVCRVNECLARAGLGNAGGYAWIWRKLSPRLEPSAFRNGEETWPYAWQDVCPSEDALRLWYFTLPEAERLPVEGPVREYDLNSAYGWSIGVGELPVPSSAKFTRRPRAPSVQALALVSRGAEHREDSPRCVKAISEREVWVRVEDLERYSIPARAVRLWVDFAATLDLRPHIERIFKILEPCTDRGVPWAAKEVMQKAWGAWSQSGELKQHLYDRGKIIRSHALRAFRWPEIMAHVVSRVNARLHDAVRPGGALRVYTDSVMTLRELPTSRAWGAWRLESEVPRVYLYRNCPGRIDLEGRPWKHAGELWDRAIARWRGITDAARGRA